MTRREMNKCAPCVLIVLLIPVSRQVLDQDNFSPIPVATEEEYRQFTSQFPFQDPELDKLPFPKKLPFSEFVPQVYFQLREFIDACLKYYEDLHLSSTEIDDVIRKSTNLLLTRTLSNCLQYAMKKKNVGLAELVQVIINTTQLEASCVYLEEFISNITNVPPDTANATKLYGTSTFKVCSCTSRLSLPILLSIHHLSFLKADSLSPSFSPSTTCLFYKQDFPLLSSTHLSL
ncbi:exocyst complex component 6B-like [Salvelinus sp. IW2-2015]|uniref:exocyst complex component 6B-like n=1 Tax=Salvelinus sp. IW2-2015 TaxID=2691554 RepID=UPI000CEAA263|nr:exocyst complex component 6B-like [Salvelinus alpinus]